MDEQDSIAGLVERWRRGDADAAAELFARYSDRLTRVAEDHLSRRVAAREGGDDIVQSVFRTFFRRCAEGQFRIDGANALWRLLVKITLLKARAKQRRHLAARRDVRAETPGGGEEWLAEVAEREPGPVEAAVLVDEIESLLHGLPPEFGQILELSLQDHSRTEAAQLLGVSRQTVYRALNLLQQRLDRSLGGEA
jgi:RNA polymerase sigma factor (sigma-70 family)